MLYLLKFKSSAHQNWFGMDDILGPVAVSIKKERVELRRGNTDASTPLSQLVWQYRLLIRTSELLTLRGSILEDALINIKQTNSASYNTKEVLEYVAPELQLNCLRFLIYFKIIVFPNNPIKYPNLKNHPFSDWGSQTEVQKSNYYD